MRGIHIHAVPAANKPVGMCCLCGRYHGDYLIEKLSPPITFCQPICADCLDLLQKHITGPDYYPNGRSQL